MPFVLHLSADADTSWASHLFGPEGLFDKSYTSSATDSFLFSKWQNDQQRREPAPYCGGTNRSSEIPYRAVSLATMQMKRCC